MKKHVLKQAPSPKPPVVPTPRWRWAEWLGLALLFGIVVAKTLCPIYDPDLWFHMKGAELMLQHRSIPLTDPFSSTVPDHIWVSSGWLSSMLLYLIYHLLGANGVIGLVVLTIAGTVAVALRVWRQEGGSPYLAYPLGAVMLWVGAARFRPRGDLFSLLLIALVLWVLVSYRRSRNPRLLLLLPALCLLWANLHTGFTAGLLLIGLFVVGEGLGMLRGNVGLTRRELSLVTAALATSAVATLANPYGLRIWTFGLVVGRSKMLAATVAEWFPLLDPRVIDARLIILTGILLAAALLLQLLRPRRLDLTALLWVLAFIGLTLKWQRQVAPFAVVALIASALSPGAREIRSTPLTRILSLAALAGMMTWSLVLGLSPGGSQGDRIGLGVDSTEIPLRAAEFIERNHLPGPVFNTYSLGGPLIWGCWPRLKVYIDGRADVYGDEFIQGYQSMLDSPKRFKEMLDREKIRLVVIGPPDPIDRILEVLTRDPAWHVVYMEDTAMIFLRETPETREQVRRLGYRYLNHPEAPGNGKLSAEDRAGVHREIDRVIRESGGSVRALLAAVMAYQALGEKEQSLAALRQAVHNGPNWAQAHMLLAVALWDEPERREEALAHFRTAAAIRPQNGDDQLNLALALSELNRNDEARGHYARGYYLTAQRAAKEGRSEEALAALVKCRDADPGVSRRALSDPDFAAMRNLPGFEASAEAP